MTRRTLVVDVAYGWVGTPYHHHGRVRGAGVDCAMLLAEVYQSAGLVGRIDPGNYPIDWHQHQHKEMYREWLGKYASPVGAPLAGDVALYKFGNVGSHAAIVIEWPVIIHSYIRKGCVLDNGEQGFLAGRLEGFWCIRGIDA